MIGDGRARGRFPSSGRPPGSRRRPDATALSCRATSTRSTATMIHSAPQGAIHAVQRGLNAGLLCFGVDDPATGSFFYFQDLTALNDLLPGDRHQARGCRRRRVARARLSAAHRRPWTPKRKTETLAAGETVILSDAILLARPDDPGRRARLRTPFSPDARRRVPAARLAADRLSHDWIGRAERTVRDLDERARGDDQSLRPALCPSLHRRRISRHHGPDVGGPGDPRHGVNGHGEPHALEAEFKAGCCGKFYDEGTEDAAALSSQCRRRQGCRRGRQLVSLSSAAQPRTSCALDGDAQARTLFLRSLDCGIKAAHHFGYKWPIQYKVTDFTVITESAGADGRGQTDVGGVYAWVMLQAFELTDEKRFLDEARAAIDAAIGLGFDINYQANLTAWGAAACMRLWRITHHAPSISSRVMSISRASSTIARSGRSELGHAVHYRNFLGVTCLQDAPYMAIYECFDSFAAFEHYLDDSGPDLEAAARMLIAEYCKYALDRAWYYYPDALPPKRSPISSASITAISTARSPSRSRIFTPPASRRARSARGIYGAGAAFVFATRAVPQGRGRPLPSLL